jgi:hypothetical protein
VTELSETRSDKQNKRGKRIFRKDLAVFSFFLFLSFIFWYLNSLGKEIEAEINYPIQYINPPKGKLIADEEPAKLTLTLKGGGYTILKLKFMSNRTPLIVDISEVSYKRVPGGGGIKYYIVTSSISRNLPSRYKSGCDITSVKPDTLIFTLDEYKEVDINNESDD